MAGPEPSEDTMIVSPSTLKRAYETGEFSDLTIRVDGEEFKLHKLVVGGQSLILKEKIKDENSITLIPVKDLEYIGVHGTMFRFMYGFNYNDSPWIDDNAFHFDVYRVARRYEVLGLQNLAFENIEKIANRDAWDADQFVKILKNRLDKDTLEEDDELFNFLIDTCHEHIDELANNVDFEDVLEDDDTLAKYLILSWGDSQKKYGYPHCVAGIQKSCVGWKGRGNTRYMEFEKNTEVYEAVFRFMYGLKYDNPIVSSCMSFHAQVYQLAVCLGVLELRTLAKRNFKKCIKTAWDADEFLKVLRMAKFFPEYCISACREHIDGLSNKPEFENVLRSDSEMARELAIMLGKSLRSYCCPQCNQAWSLDCSLSSPSYCPTCGHHEQDWDKFRK